MPAEIPVHSHTEWGTLEEVILGSHYNTTVGSLDVSMKMLFHDNIQRMKRKHPGYNYTIRKEYIDEREEDTSALAVLLTSLGVTVRRPALLEDVKPITTPYWESVTKACDNPRDRVLILGDRIIETPCCVRTRYFENDLLKPLLYEYFARGARWTSAPQPMLKDASFDRSYVEGETQTSDEGMELIFDAAQCLRFGRDILFNTSTRNHRMGAVWLRRELGNDFRVHEVSITDNHLDGAMMPLRPGKLLVNDRMIGKLHLLPKGLQSWDVLHVKDEDLTAYREDDVLLSSTRIDVNILSLDTERVVVNEKAIGTIRMLEKHGFVTIPIRFRHSRIFAGGIHCVSLDIRRDDALEDYLK
jgi:glycine amidinotransferase